MNIDRDLSICANSLLGKRSNQEDYYLYQQQKNNAIAIVCDGMGGLQGGAIASKKAADLFFHDVSMQKFNSITESFYLKELAQIDDAIYSLQDKDGNRIGAGTTMLAVIINEGKLKWFSVGDTRLFIYRNRESYAITRMHNYQLKLDSEKGPNIIEEKGEQLISYLGMGMAELYDGNEEPFTLQKYDVLLMCTDGVYRSVDEIELEKIIKGNIDVNVMSEEIKAAITKRNLNNQDNATWIIIQKTGESNE